MLKTREQREYEAELEALQREKELYRSKAAAIAKDRRLAAADNRQLPLIYWLGWAVAQNTRGSARLDLTRPRFPAVEPGNLLKRVNPALAQGAASFGVGRVTRRGYNPEPGQQAPLFGFGQGARIKVMRHLDFGVPDRFRRRERALENAIADRELSKKGFLGKNDAHFDPLTDKPVIQQPPDLGQAVSSIQDALKQNLRPPEKPWFDIGAGINLELDEGALQPTVRLKVKDFFSIKLLPEPMFKIQKRIQFGPTNFGVRVNYELPLIDAKNLWAPPARLMIRLDNRAGGLKVGPGGADFDESVLQLGESTTVRAGLSVDFPRTLPLEEGEKIFGWRARRLGIKTRW